MRNIISIILVLIAIGVFVGFFRPTYARVAELKATQTQYAEVLKKSRELQAIRDELLSRYNTFTREDLDRISKLLPDSLDNVRLIMEIDNIAKRLNLSLADVVVEDPTTTEAQEIVAQKKDFSSVTLNFSVNASYENFTLFIKSLEDSLRLVDIVAISFRSTEKEDFNRYTIKVKTYWLP